MTAKNVTAAGTSWETDSPYEDPASLEQSIEKLGGFQATHGGAAQLAAYERNA